MEICFRFTADCPTEQPLHDELEAQLAVFAAATEARRGEVVVSPTGYSSRFSVDCSDEASISSLLSSPELLGVLSQFARAAEANGFAWHISHDHDDDVGTLATVEDVASTIEQMTMACEIARLMTEEPIDSADEELSATSPTMPGDSENEWSSLLGSPETFVRFPDWDEVDDESLGE
ncbi:MAG: hypothetical protein AAF802_09840 [Planctomycetota bacterium]